MDAIVRDILGRVRLVLGEGHSEPLHAPLFEGAEAEYLMDCLKSTFVSSVGRYVDAFEIKLAEYTGHKRAVAVVNGTAALQLALRLVGVERDDEVLVPGLSFIATANAVAYLGANAHFVDSEESTLGMAPEKLAQYLDRIAVRRDGLCVNRASGRVIRAIVPMHTLGVPVRMQELGVVAQAWHLAIVEDAAESLGSFYQGAHTGHQSSVAALSFNGNKIITTGGGGALLFNDEQLAARAKHLSTTARVVAGHHFRHDALGYNFRMPNINAALGCAQLENLPRFVAQKRALAQRYVAAFAGSASAAVVTELPGSQSNYWLNAIRIQGSVALRDQVLDALNQAGYMSRPLWDLLPSLPMYRAAPCDDLSTARRLIDTTICIPSSANAGSHA